jgi:superfamily II DNA or RNA helicase
MKLIITEDKKFLRVEDSTQLEIEQLESSFTKKPDNWFIIRKKLPHWDGEIKFIDRYSRIPLGLWGEVQKLAKKYNFPLNIEGKEYLTDKDFNEEDFDSWVVDHFEHSKLNPRDYQNEAARRALKFRICTEEISTSGGKTLIAYMIFRYLLDRKRIKKMLYIVPNVGLVEQTEDKFFEYEAGAGIKNIPWKSVGIYGGSERRNEAEANVVFGTYQSLAKKSLEYFGQFDAVIVDETHHAKANSIKTILVKCYNAQWKMGLTGSLPKEGSCDSFTIQAYLGPMVYQLHSHKLIEEGNATPVHVVGIEMDYLSEDVKKNLYELRMQKADEKDGSKLLNLEKQIAREDRKRLLYVCDIISRAKKNALVLFADIKNSYGRNIYDWLRENTEKNAYYIDGSTEAERREFYKKKMEEEENVVLVASIGTFSEGIDILNVHNIYIVESNKSEIIIRQILGRGMRLMDGKLKITVFDFSDNYQYGTHQWQKKNYLIRHADERRKIYKEKRFPYKLFRVKL